MAARAAGKDRVAGMGGDDESPAERGDPVVDAYLAFLEEDMRTTPAHLVSLTETDATRLERLTRDIPVSDDEEISPDVTL